LGVLAFWLILFSRIFVGDGVAAWSVGLAYVGYDTALLLFVASAWPSLWRDAPPAPAPGGPRPSVGVIIAARDEAAVLAATIDALLAQTDPPDAIWLADDGSTDESPAKLRARYGLEPPEIGRCGAPGPIAPTLRWLRLPPGGKARALNAALAYVDTDVVLTVDADTLLEPSAIAAVRAGFAADPDLVVGGGVLAPHCDASLMGRCLREFQTYEYVRNFLARLAWSRLDCLLLISGAFAAFRRDAVLAVGGFDTRCLVEDYELMHRIHRWAVDRGLNWRVRILNGARARTDAPGRILPFLRQRRRWFAGFLQTQYWNRDMTGNPRFGALGLAMMPVKALDTMQPIFGLISAFLLLEFLVAGRWSALIPASGFALAKIAFDLAYGMVAVEAYRRWTGAPRRLSLTAGLVAAALEPFSFQILRHAGAAWGWVAFLGQSRAWGGSSRSGRSGPVSGAPERGANAPVIGGEVH
jgi:cellulose synthase/poly-beta-1,6-N-acetylglucosamine synthase-like glycosyltransferase